jgi:drug/metabolite transporter (DMT)-like permease
MTVVSIYWGLGTFGVDKIFATLLIFAGVYIVTRSKKRGNYLIK